MFRSLVVVLAMCSSVVSAEDWVPLKDNANIEAALADRTVRYDALTFQYFGSDGATQYITERASDGRWAAREGQYCSTWPPSDLWTCYDFEVRGEQVRFIGSDDSVSVGFYEN